MAAKRVAIINASNVCVNIILIDNPMPRNYWPGYGFRMIPLEGPMIVSFSGIPIVNVTPSLPLQIGDTINTSTGVVTKAIIQQAPDLTNLAPVVALTKDVNPTVN